MGVTELTFGEVRKIYNEYKDYFDFDEPDDVKRWIRQEMERVCLRKHNNAQAQRIAELEAGVSEAVKSLATYTYRDDMAEAIGNRLRALLAEEADGG